MNLQDARKKLPELNGLSDESALNVIHQVYYPHMDKADLAGRLGYKAPEATVAPRSAMRAVGDLATQFGTGAVSGVRMMTDMFGADNRVSQGLRSAEEALGGLLSAQALGDQQKIADIMKEAEGKGWADQVVSGLKAAGVAPGALMAQALGTSMPTLATALIPGAGPAAVATRLGAAGVMGAAQGAGNIKGVIYEDVKKELAKDPSLTPEQIEARAVEAQSFAGPNAGQIALGGALGVAAGTTGMEKVVSGLRNGVTKAPAGIMGRMLGGGAAEAVPEFAQGGQEKYASNTALNNEGFDVDPMSGVIAQGTMEAAAGFGAGALTGIPKPKQMDAADVAANAVLDAKLMPETGPMTRAANVATTIEADKVRQEVGQSITGTSMADMLRGPTNPMQDALAARGDPTAEESLSVGQPAADQFPDAGKMVGDQVEQPLNMVPDVIGRQTGGNQNAPYSIWSEAKKEMEARGLEGTHEVVSATDIDQSLSGFLISRKSDGAAPVTEPAPASNQVVEPKPQTASDKPANLPKNLAGAKPRYGFGARQYTPTFESDIDKAAFIAAGQEPSKRDADYVRFVMGATGMTEPEVMAHGQKVKASMKAIVKPLQGAGHSDEITVPKLYAPAAKPAAPDVSLTNEGKTAPAQAPAVTAESGSTGPASKFKVGDSVRIIGETARHEIESIGKDGWIYTRAGGASPAEKWEIAPPPPVRPLGDGDIFPPAAPVTQPANTPSSKYQTLADEWNAKVQEYKAATPEQQTAMQPEMDELKARLEQGRQGVVAESFKSFKEQEKTRALKERAENDQKYGGMAIGTRIGMPEHASDDSIYWEKTGDNEWSRTGMGSERPTKTNAEMFGDRVIQQPATSGVPEEGAGGSQPPQVSLGPLERERKARIESILKNGGKVTNGRLLTADGLTLIALDDHELAAIPGDKKEKKPQTDKQKREALESHYRPGNVIQSDYWKSYDRVVAFDWNDGSWKVTVEEVKKDGDNWKAAGDKRTHMTKPDARDKVVFEAPAQVAPAKTAAPPWWTAITGAERVFKAKAAGFKNVNGSTKWESLPAEQQAALNDQWGPKGTQPAPAQDQNSPQSRWTRATTAERIAIARAGGIALKPAENVARKGWADHDPVVQEKLARGMQKQEVQAAPDHAKALADVQQEIAEFPKSAKDGFAQSQLKMLKAQEEALKKTIAEQAPPKIETDDTTAKRVDETAKNEQVAPAADKVLGQNENGQTLMVDAKGVRYYKDGNFKISEPVRLHMSRDGVEGHIANRRDEFKTVEELAADKPAEVPSTRTFKTGEVVGVKFQGPERVERMVVKELPKKYADGKVKIGVQSELGLSHVFVELDRIFDAPAAVAQKIQPGEPGYTLAMAREDLQALHDRNGGMVEDARINSRIKQQEKLIKDMEAEQANPDTQPDPVKPARLPEAVQDAIENQLRKQRARIARLSREADAADLTLEQKLAAQTKVKAAEATQRKLRTDIFAAEDAAQAALEAKNAALFAPHADLFPDAADAISKALGQNDELDAEMRSYEAKAEKPTKPAATPAAKPADPDAEAKAKAQQDLDDALGELGMILTKGIRKNMLPEQERALLPVLTQVMDASFRLGYYKFKESARFVLDKVRAKFGGEVADMITLDHLQGAYIGMAGKYQDKGASTKKEVIAIESLDELGDTAIANEATKDENATPTTPTTDTTQNATRQLDQPSPSALEGTPAQAVQGVGEQGDSQPAAGGRGGGDIAGDAEAGSPGVQPAGGVGNDAGAVPVPSRGTRSKRGSATKRGTESAAGAEREPSLFGDDGRGNSDGEGAGRVEAPAFKPTDFTIEEDFALGEGGQKTKYRNNIDAIKLLGQLEKEGRFATPDEQSVLAKYVGWGGLAQAFDDKNESWSKEFAELRGLLTDEEYDAARRSTRYAHYTSRPIIQAMYQALKFFGFTGGRMLEPGAGVGNFMGLMPADLRSSSRLTGVERERIAAGIAKHLYPNQNMQLQDFTVFDAPDGYFDATLGNPPFAADAVIDQSGRKHLNGFSVHDYFFAKSIDMLREGGVFAAVVSNGFMDKQGDKARKYIGDRAKLLGAIRLPNNAFAKNANTEVTTDIVFFQKLPESEWGGKAARQDLKRWLDTALIPDPKGGKPIAVNQYFADNPNMMLGEYGRFGTMYGPDQPALVARTGQDTNALLTAAIGRLPKNIYTSAAKANTDKANTDLIEALRDTTVDEGGFYVDDGKLYQRMPDQAGETSARLLTPETQWTEKTKLGESKYQRLMELAAMRKTMRQLLAAELAGDKAMDGLRKTLNEQYDAYAATHGLINDASTAQVFDDDPDFPLLAALELGYERGMGPAAAKAQGIKPYKSKAKKAPIFERRVIENRQQVQRAETAEDALNVSIAERGMIDAGYIAQLLGKPADQVLAELTKGAKPLLFVDPVTGEHVLRDAYLSGNVRKKLEQARMAGSDDNVRALMAVQPEDVGAHEISAKLGAPWVPTTVYEDFAVSLLGEGTKAHVSYMSLNSSFSSMVNAGSDAANTVTFGTRDMPATKILDSLLNNRTVKVMGIDSDGKPYLDKEKTDLAQEKAQDIKAKFQDWLFTDPERSELLVRAYNDTNNNYVTRQFDGNYMTFPGKVPDSIIKFRRHQRNAIARIVQDRTALLDHVVGAGKTFTVISGAMELKRTGLAKKPMIAVPNHLVKQWATDFYRLYPGAKILTATKKDFEKNNRRRFLAKIATGDWDAVIMAHSSFGFIQPDPDFESAFNQSQVDKIMQAIQEAKADGGDKSAKRRTVKQLEGMTERLENRIKSLREKAVDNLLDFKQLGVDQLFVDEAHLFKNLMFGTKMQNVRGLGDSKGSQRAYDMYVKVNQIYAQNGRGQGVVFATGTPVSNSLAEMYHMMRYLMPQAMDDGGFGSFDAWANTYAEVSQVWMQKTSGDGFKASDRMGTFSNVHELLKMFDQVSDTVTMDDIKQAFSEENNGKEFPLPKLKGDRRTPVSLEKSQAQIDYMADIANRAKALEQKKGPPKKGEDNFLTIMSDARKAAMDIRLVDPTITQREPGARIDRSSDEVVKRYKQYDSVKGAQLVFSDLGTPLSSAKKELKEYEALQERIAPLQNEDLAASAALGDEAAMRKIEDAEAAQEEMDAKGGDWLGAVQAAMRGFSVYDDMKAALIEKGIPENEIAFIHDFNTDDQKAALFRKVNSGIIRVVIGSTPKMGAGTNVQERLVALHHLDVPWKPSDIEQREGRIIRQGNVLADTMPGFEVEVLAYVTQDTLDMRMWQTQEVKLKMINQLRTRQIGREIENPFEEAEMSAGEMQAAATGNMDLLKEIQLRTEVKKLEQRKRSFDAQRGDLANRKRRANDSVASLPGRIKGLETLSTAANEYLKSTANPDFKATINGETYTSRYLAEQELRRLVDENDEFNKDKAKDDTRKLSVDFNGKVYGSKTALGEAMTNYAGDRDPIAWTFGGETFNRRSSLSQAIQEAVVDAGITDTAREIGTLGRFTVTVEGNRNRLGMTSFDVSLTVDGKTDDTQMSYTAGGDGRVQADAVIRAVERLVSNLPGRYNMAQQDLETAQKAVEDLAKVDMPDTWPEMGKLEAARAQHKAVLDRLSGKTKDEPVNVGSTNIKQTGAPEANETDVVFSRGQTLKGMTKADAESVVKGITDRWANAPEVVVVQDMQDAAVTEAVRLVDAKQKSRGAKGESEGFFYDGKVYIVAGALRSPGAVMRVLFHETLGHYGLRGTFGSGLTPILKQLAALRRGDVAAKAAEYGLDMKKEADRLTAAEEVLAEMAQSKPEIGFVKRVIALIWGFLRKHVPGFAKMQMTDEDIIANYILPARKFVERGPGGGPRGGVSFSRSAMKSVDANIKRGLDSLAKALDERSTVHRAMFRNGLGWVDFVWGSEGSLKPSGKTKGAMGLSHIVEARNRKDKVEDGDVVLMLTKMVEAIASGKEIRRNEFAEAVTVVVEKDGVEAILTKRKGSNAWVVSGWNVKNPDAITAGSVASDATSVKPTTAQRAGVAGFVEIVRSSGSDVNFSRTMGATELAGQMRDKLNETFNHPGKLSWWHKTVGSQYNLAERNPAFKKVFDAAQSFINDVSYYGTEAANMAPKMLPKLETLKDLTKTAISAADNKAVAAPVFEGTLSWARDADGRPIRIEALERQYENLTDSQKAQMLLRKNVVSEAQLKAWKASKLDVYTGAVRNRFESTFLKAGVRWTDAELKSIFKLTDEQVGLYKEFRAATDTSLDNMAKAQMLREAGKDVADMRDMVMEAPDVDTAAMMLRETLLDLAKDDPDRADVLTDAAAGVLDTAAKINDLKKQGYAPLSRFGRFTVDVVVDGQREYFGLFESEGEANRMAAKMRMEFGADNVAQGTMSQKEFELFQGITPESLELFGNMMGLDSTGNEAQDKAFQTYLKLTKNNRSAMKRLIHRQGIAGYSEDVGRVLAAFVYANARQTSAALHIGQMDEAITAIPKGEGELKDHALELAKYIKEPQEEAAALRGLLFAQYLGGSVASAMVNFTQPLTVSIPYLSQFGGLAKAGKAWAQAVKDMSKGTKLEAGLERALKDAEESGVVSPQEIHQLMAQARGAATLQSGDGTRKGDAMAMVKNGWTRTALAWGKLFGYAEQVNRRSTFIAAYRMAVDQKIANPGAFAEKAVNETQFINNKANKMKFGRGAIGATLMTFKSYSLNWLELVHRMSTQDGAEGKLAAAYMLGALFLVAGVGGLPFAEDAEDLIDAIGQKMGYNFSTKKAKQEFLEELFGKDGAAFVERGVTGIAGVPIDLAGRMGMQNLIPGTGLLLEKRDSTRDAVEVLGPAADLAKRAFQAVGKLVEGEVLGAEGALMTAAPRAVANVGKGVDMLDTGMYRDTKGAKVIDTTPGEAVAKMIGFQPQSVSKVQESNFINQRAKDFYSLRTQEIRSKWAMGIFLGDQDKVKEARQMMDDWNQDNPDQKMTANMPAIIKKVREMRKDKAQRIADTAPKAMRAQMREDARELTGN